MTAVRAGFSHSQLLTDDELNELDDLCADYIDLRSENGLLKPCCVQNASFYQDRLGTDIGKPLKKEWRFLAERPREGSLQLLGKPLGLSGDL